MFEILKGWVLLPEQVVEAPDMLHQGTEHVQVKVKLPLSMPGWQTWEAEVELQLFLISECLGCITTIHTPPRIEPRTHCRRLSGPHAQSGHFQKEQILLPLL